MLIDKLNGFCGVVFFVACMVILIEGCCYSQTDENEFSIKHRHKMISYMVIVMTIISMVYVIINGLHCENYF